MIFLYGKKLKLTLEMLEQLRYENSTLKNEVVFLKDSIEHERVERDKLQDCILKKTGFMQSEIQQDIDKELKPIGRGVANWERTRRDLEFMTSKKFAKVQPLKEEELKELDELIVKGENNAS